jgi:glutathione peroxidase
LTKSKDAPAGGPVHWNYTKFFVNKEGKVIARLGQDVTPDSPEMISTIEQILDGRYKPKKGGKEGPPSDGGGDDDDE